MSNLDLYLVILVSILLICGAISKWAQKGQWTRDLDKAHERFINRRGK